LTSAGIEVPQGQKIWKRDWWWWRWLEDVDVLAATNGGGGGDGLAEVTRVRQFFPETWLWTPDFMTGPDGKGTINLTAPDSITTWRLHAVSTSEKGLGVGESKLVVFQEFFGEPDLPYAVTRGEEFPVRIQVFNYLDETQKVCVELAKADWFEMLEDGVREVEVGANSVGLASFVIKPKKLGRNMLEVTLRSPLRADAVRKEMLVEAEGTRREMVDNGMIKAGEKVTLDGDMPEYRVAGSEKALLSVTPSLVAQSINGVEDLLQMPYGCGEQNMIFFAPDVEILRYLNATGQLTPEIRAKAESFINAGYQRELTYRRADGSFSAFGDSDDSGSLWLTAFVLDVFSGARDVHAIDDGVLAGAAAWIQGRQLADGSWEPVGFLHHQDMMGGLSGNYTLTAFVTIALADYGSANPAVLSKAMQYLGANTTTVWDEPYALAVAGLAMVRAGNPAAEAIISRLLEMAIRDGDGMHWEPYAIETTAYAALAMIDKEMAQANDAIKWISLQQNAQGGFGNTQDTVMALKALMTAARAQSRNVDLVLTVNAAETADGTDGAELARFEVNGSNFDVLQVAAIPAGIDIRISAEGSGEVRYQLLRRFNVLLRDECVGKDMSLEVVYDADDVEVDDIVKVHVTVRYFGAAEQTGMMIVDVGVPTGFAVVQESLDALLDAKVVSRADIAGRKVIFYVDGLAGGEERTFIFEVKARYPVRAIIPDSKAYLYYEPQVRAENEGVDITVKAKAGQAGVYFAALKDIADNWLHIGDIDIKGDENQDMVVDMYDLAVLGLRWMK
jgi:CD109 antigen